MFENWPNENALITDPFIGYLIFSFACFFPLYKISQRLGLPFWTSLPIFIPYIGMIITAGLFAHMEWHQEKTVTLYKRKKKQ